MSLSRDMHHFFELLVNSVASSRCLYFMLRLLLFIFIFCIGRFGAVNIFLAHHDHSIA